MADSLPTYSAREVSVAWGGLIFDGFSADNICTLMYNTDLTTESIGCDGLLATSVTPDRTGTVAIELMQTSKSSRMLANVLFFQNNLTDTSQILKADIAVADPSGSVLAIARNAYIKTAPEIALGVETATHEWTFYSEKIDFLSIPSGVTDAAEQAEFAAIIAGMVASQDLL